MVWRNLQNKTVPQAKSNTEQMICFRWGTHIALYFAELKDINISSIQNMTRME
jgi:hypothetical protein